MAARRGMRQLMEVIDDAEVLQEWIDKSDDLVVVVDLFKDWCGYCSVMEPTYNTLFLDLDNFEERVKLLAIDSSKLTEEQLKIIPVNPGCKPSFVVFKHKVAIGKVQGANAPEVAMLVRENVFPVKPKDE
ncbi:unnamed protein product [Symbiodinium sp. KB8]|nr:unnamed protein product [Symbiodinium sp. KB8]